MAQGSDSSLNDALSTWRDWVPAIRQAPEVLLALNEGRTNHSFLLQTTAGRAVLRVGRKNPQRLGINRTHEALILNQVAAAGVSPQPWFINRETGDLVTPYIEGEVYTAQSLPDRHRQQLWRMLNVVHSQDLQLPPFDYLSHLDNYRTLLNRQNRGGQWLWEQDWLNFRCKLQSWQDKNPRDGLCHHDLSGANILVDGERMQLIDWEYSGLGYTQLDRLCSGMPLENPANRRGIAILRELETWLTRLWELLASPENG